MKGQGKELDEPAPANKPLANKFGAKGNKGHQVSNNSSVTGGLDQIHMTDKDINVRS